MISEHEMKQAASLDRGQGAACLRRLAVMAFALLPALSARAGDGGDAWARHLQEDVRRFHAAIGESHPGTVDEANPGFNALLAGALDKALARAGDTRDAGGYWWAMREFQAAFDDGHVQMVATREWIALPKRWPGFLTRFEGDRQVIAANDGDDASPPMGATLESCDGMPAEALARERLGRFSGRWTLEAQRADLGPRLFIDEGNPWIAPLRECVFSFNGQPRTVTLRWRGMDAATFDAQWARVQPTMRATVALESLPHQVTWLSLGTFDGDPQSESYPALVSLVSEVKAQAGAIRQGVWSCWTCAATPAAPRTGAAGSPKACGGPRPCNGRRGNPKAWTGASRPPTSRTSARFAIACWPRHRPMPRRSPGWMSCSTDWNRPRGKDCPCGASSTMTKTMRRPRLSPCRKPWQAPRLASTC